MPVISDVLGAKYDRWIRHRVSPRVLSPSPPSTDRPVASEQGEHDYPQLLVSPHPDVVRALRGATDALALCRGGLPSHLEPELAGQEDA